MTVLPALAAASVVALYVWQDGVNDCQDGQRYCSGERQPTPFHRRFCAWPPRLLACVTWLSFVGLAASFGSLTSALLFVTLPGVWFCCVLPTTVDGPAMLLAWGASLALPHSTPLAVGLSLLSGFVHERAPVFASLYAWSPLLLVGLALPLLRSLLTRPAEADHDSSELADRLVGHTSTWRAALAHRPHVDMLGDGGLVWSLRGLVPLAAWLGAEPRAWAALGLSFFSRLIATDTARSMLWAAPPLIAGLERTPHWALALHVLSFRRATR